MRIFVVNAGSSSLKFGLYDVTGGGAAASTIVRGAADSLSSDSAALKFDVPSGRQPIHLGASTPSQAAVRALQAVSDGPEPGAQIDAVGFRVVHGGSRFTEPAVVTGEVLVQIRALADRAPLHNPMDADIIEGIRSARPDLPAVAVFDTAFHHTLPAVACTYALPWQLCEAHDIRRYGFHGISYRYVTPRLAACIGRRTMTGNRLVVCHLGNGASVCALLDGRSVDTSMGFTPLEGLVMGTRCGDVDPGLVLYLLRSLKMSADDVDRLLNGESGLAGLSKGSGDVRALEQAAKGGDPRAELALEVFSYRVAKYIGAYTAALGGLDAVGFTGGIGEHSANVRERICSRLGFLGITLDANLNLQTGGAPERRISSVAARVQVWIVPTDEESQIAAEVRLALDPEGNAAQCAVDRPD